MRTDASVVLAGVLGCAGPPGQGVPSGCRNCPGGGVYGDDSNKMGFPWEKLSWKNWYAGPRNHAATERESHENAERSILSTGVTRRAAVRGCYDGQFGRPARSKAAPRRTRPRRGARLPPPVSTRGKGSIRAGSRGTSAHVSPWQGSRRAGGGGSFASRNGVRAPLSGRVPASRPATSGD